MGTRGYVVIKINNKYYCYYNHYDSYPSNLGQNILNELIEIDYAEYKEKLKKLKSYNESCDWPGSLEDIVELYNFKPDAEDDPEDLHYNPIIKLYNDIFIEYIYKIDFDNDEFEMYCYWNKFRMVADLNDIPFTKKVFEMFCKKC